MHAGKKDQQIRSYGRFTLSPPECSKSKFWVLGCQNNLCANTAFHLTQILYYLHMYVHECITK